MSVLLSKDLLIKKWVQRWWPKLLDTELITSTLLEEKKVIYQQFLDIYLCHKVVALIYHLTAHVKFWNAALTTGGNPQWLRHDWEVDTVLR